MPTLPSKKDVLLGLLEKTSVLVHLDARREDVQVPKNLKSNAQLILQLGLNLAVPIKDLEVTDVGVSCTLSFARTPFYCVLPYPAIFAMVSEDGGKAMVWPEDVPAEVARAAEAEARKLGLIKGEKTEDVRLEAPRDTPSQPSIQSAKKSRDEKVAASQQLETTLAAKRAAKPKIAARATSEDPAGKRTETTTRPKRELPPYLRVIK